MAVYQGTGARIPVGTGLPAAGRTATRSVRVPVRTARRLRPMGVILAFIIAGTLLGLVYLTQTLRSAVTSYEIEQLLAERARLQREIRSQQGTIAGWGSEPTVLQWAQQEGLSQLGKRIVVPAR